MKKNKLSLTALKAKMNEENKVSNANNLLGGDAAADAAAAAAAAQQQAVKTQGGPSHSNL